MTGIQKLDWRVVVGAQSFTPENPGNLKGAIVLDYNSVGACVGGSLTFEGYVYWAPFSDVISVFVNGVPIGYGVVGLVSTTLSETGKRTSTVPILGMHAIDAEGLAAVGLGGSYELLGIEHPLAPIPTEVKETDALGFPVTKTVLVDPPFGETVNAAFQRVFKDHPLASWGVRPNGQRVAGIPFGGPNISSGAVNVRAQPSNYELTSYVSEFAERPAERWKPRVQSRNVGWLMPRRGATVQTDDLLGDQKTAAPLSLSPFNFDGTPERGGYVVGTVDIYDLVYNSVNNPTAKNADYALTGVSVTVEITLDHSALPSAPPEDWRGQNVLPLGTWQDYADIQPLSSYMNRIAAGESPQGWGELWDAINAPGFPYFTTTQNPETKVITAKDGFYFKSVAERGWNSGFGSDEQGKAGDYQLLINYFPFYFRDTYPKLKTEEALKQWGFYTSQIGATAVVAEWLTTSSISGAAAAAHESAPVRNETQPVYQPGPPSDAPFAAFGEAMRKLAWMMDPANYQANNAQYDIDPRRDKGLLQPRYRDVVRLTPDNRVLTWTFSVPKELVGQLDGSLPANYRWAFGAAFSGIRLGLTARGKITASAMYQKVMSGATNIHRDLPAFEQQPLVTPTLQGVILGEIHTGPFTVDGQQMANARVVIEANGYRTEFQTGAANGGR